MQWLRLIFGLLVVTFSFYKYPTVYAEVVVTHEKNNLISKEEEIQRSETEKRIADLKIEVAEGDAATKLHAQMVLGEIYYHDDLFKDDVEAFKWYSLVAQAGIATHELGEMYETGRVVRQDYEEAYFLQLLSIFPSSDVVPPQPSEAFKTKLSKLQRRAVMDRVAASVRKLDGWVIHFLGCEALFAEDYEWAYFWFSVGKREDIENQIEDENLIARAMEHLTAQQMATMERRAKDWKIPPPPNGFAKRYP